MEKGQIIQELIKAYSAELETVQNYIATSVNLDGVRSDIIKKSLAADGSTVHREVGVCRRDDQRYLQPPADTTDVVTVIKGVIAAEEAAIAQYNKIIKLCDQVDYPTQDLCIEILGDEEEHRREFIGFLKEYEKSAK